MNTYEGCGSDFEGDSLLIENVKGARFPAPHFAEPLDSQAKVRFGRVEAQFLATGRG